MISIAKSLLFHRRRTLVRHAKASVLSLLVLSAALGLLWLGYWLPSIQQQKLDIREIALAVPPPPPPPPPPQQPIVESPVTLEVQGSGPAINIAKIEQKIEWQEPDVPPIETSETNWQTLDINWDAFSLDDLDSTPTLITPLRLTLPKSLSQRGIEKVLVKLDIMINEKGKVTLNRIALNPHPELIPELQRMIPRVRFTAPTKDKKAVRVQFIWPIEIRA